MYIQRFSLPSAMAEDLGDDWWDTSGKKTDEPVIDETDIKINASKKKRKRKRVNEVDSNAMSSEDDIKAALIEVVGNVAKEELAEWIDSANVRLVWIKHLFYVIYLIIHRILIKVGLII